MKKIRLTSYFLLFLFTVTTILAGCREDGYNPTLSTPIADENTYIFRLDKSNIVIETASASETSLTITSYNVNWEFVRIPDWVTVSPVKGTTGNTLVTVHVNENPSTIRTGQLTCRENGVNDTIISITQYGH